MAELNQTEQLLADIFARISMIEGTLCLLWNSHPDKEAIKADAKLIAAARDAIELHDAVSDLTNEIQQKARQHSFETIFRELPPATPSGSARTA
jgi:hypothetical protein